MKTIIDDIYYMLAERGEALKNSNEYKKLSDEASDIYEEFDKSMNDEQKEKLSKLWLKEADIELEVGLVYYKAGFKAGLLLAFECLNN